ncbi:ATP-binding protein [Leifsonia sp. A12D58]|uniref:ATP-binding protein n=1 Tax=Leifsonia sp. A12D58 TaxID=3397674 RepID=UPI0039DF893C
MDSSGEARVRVAVLGPVLVEDRRGALVPPHGARGSALVQALALSRTHALSGAALIDELWADEQPVNARAALQTLVSRLRAVAADGLIASTENGYRLATQPGTTDFDLARALRNRADSLTATDPAAALALVEQALALWRAEPSELPAPTVDIHRSLTRTRAALLATLGNDAAALVAWNALAEESPFDESVALERMRALTRLGRRGDALLVFSEFRSRLRDALGSSPSAALVSFNTRLLQDDGDGDGAAESSAAPGLSVLAPAPAQVLIGLRNPPNQLVGRDEDIRHIEHALTSTRLVTILGAGGLGKTRLAQELAHRSSAPAVIVVELASVGSDEDVTFALASTLGISERMPGQRLADAPVNDLRSLIIRQLSERETLLVVDNCEHVIDGAARWVSDILASTSTVRVIATSRSPLGIGSERVYPLEPLASTADGGTNGGTAGGTDTVGGEHQGPAVRLFCERARAARPGVALPIDTIARLCTRLDGLPLAIELAAARVRSMSVDEIERRLGDRFALLVGGDRAAAERHRTLQAVIDWSWNLLSPVEQAALRRLALFPDGFGEEAAHRVALLGVHTDDPAAVLDILDALVSQSLLGVHEDSMTGQLRYRMLETVREFGARELSRAGEDQVAQQAIFDWAESFSLSAFPRLDGHTQLEQYVQIRLEHDTLLWTLRQSLAADRPDVVASVFAVLGFYWNMRGNHSEVMSFAPNVLRVMRGYEPDARRAESTLASAILVATILLLEGNRNGAVALGTVRKLAANGHPVSLRLATLARFLVRSSDRQGSVAELTTMQISSDPSTALIGHLIGVQLAENDGDLDLAQRLGARAWQLATERGDVWISSMSAMLMGQLASQNNQPTDALGWIDRAAAGLSALSADEDVRQLLWMKGANLVSIGKLDEATAVFDGFSGITAASPSSTPDGLDLRSVTMAGHAEIARARGRFDEGAALYLAAIQMHVTGRERTSPWFTMLGAALISAWVGDGTGEPEQIAAHARVLRARVLAVHRARPGFVDKPVLGTAAIGYAVWAMTVPAMADQGLELLALAEAIHGRQDLPVLHLDAHFFRVAAQFSAEQIAGMRAAAAALTLSERAMRAHELFARPMYVG